MQMGVVFVLRLAQKPVSRSLKSDMMSTFFHSSLFVSIMVLHTAFHRSMASRLRYHSPRKWAQVGGEDIHITAGVIVRRIDARRRHSERRKASWLRSQHGEWQGRFHASSKVHPQNTPKNIPDTAIEAVFIRGYEIGKVGINPPDQSLAGTGEPACNQVVDILWQPSKSRSVQTRRMGDKAASREQSPRSSTGRPRKASR